MSETNKALLLVVIQIVLVTAIFAVVAIVFHKWWIVLFSILANSMKIKIDSGEDKEN